MDSPEERTSILSRMLWVWSTSSALISSQVGTRIILDSLALRHDCDSVEYADEGCGVDETSGWPCVRSLECARRDCVLATIANGTKQSNRKGGVEFRKKEPGQAHTTHKV